MRIRFLLWAIVVVPLVLLAALGGTAPTAAAAPARNWTGFPYLSGQVCRPDPSQPDTTAPLVAWHLGDGVPPAFLMSPIIANATTVSAAPPLESVGPQSHGAIGPSPNGLADAGAVAQYAALVEHFGTGDDTQVALVADAVMNALGGGAAAGLAGCVDQNAEQALVAHAADLAGPYTIAFRPVSGNVVMGTPTQVAVAVTSASGKPVPDVSVRLTSPSPILQGRQDATVRTDSSGTAGATVQIPAGTTGSSVAVKAEVTVDTGLTFVTAQAQPSPVNPSGAVTAAVYPSGAVTASADQQLPIEQSAHPALVVSSTEQAVGVGASVSPRAAVTGMNGHSGTITFTTKGPIALANRTLCSALGATAFDAASVAATSTAQVVGDKTVSGGPVQPGQPGCYLVTARLATSDAVPAATAQGSAQNPVTVLDTTATVSTDHSLIGRAQALTGKVVLTNLHGASATVQASITGPKQIGYDRRTCAGVDYSGAATTPATTGAPSAASTGNDKAESATPFSATTSGIGCYRVTVSAVVHVAGGADIDVASTTSTSVLSIDPQLDVTLAGDAPMVVGSSPGYTIEPNATFSQAAHVTVSMVPADNGAVDCQAATYDGSAQRNTGPAVAVPATEFPSVSAHPAALTAAGCYLPVAVMTMDANPSITVTTSLDTDNASWVSPHVTVAPALMFDNSARSSEPARSVLPAGIGIGSVLVLAVVIVVVTAVRGRRSEAVDH